MDNNHTMFTDIRQGAWAVHRITTQSGSVYLIGLHSIGGRMSAVVRGEPGTKHENVIVRDTDPQIGSRSLFNLPSTEWVGQPLRVATMETSPIVSVTLVTDQKTVTAVTGAVIVRPAGGMSEHTRIGIQIESPVEPPKPAPPPYPESHVQYAEDAAWLLRAVQRRGDALFEDLDAHPQLRARMQVALAGCLLALEQMRTRVSNG